MTHDTRFDQDPPCANVDPGQVTARLCEDCGAGCENMVVGVEEEE